MSVVANVYTYLIAIFGILFLTTYCSLNWTNNPVTNQPPWHLCVLCEWFFVFSHFWAVSGVWLVCFGFVCQSVFSLFPPLSSSLSPADHLHLPDTNQPHYKHPTLAAIPHRIAVPSWILIEPPFDLVLIGLSSSCSNICHSVQDHLLPASAHCQAELSLGSSTPQLFSHALLQPATPPACPLSSPSVCYERLSNFTSAVWVCIWVQAWFMTIWFNLLTF